jgi:hypothetical protein
MKVTSLDHGRCLAVRSHVVARWWWCVTGFALPGAIGLFAGCSVVVDSDASKLGAQPIACEVGRVVPCPCADGSNSTQVCNKLARYDACACNGQAGQLGAGQSGHAGQGGSGGAGNAGVIASGGRAAGAGSAGHAAVAGH